MFERLRREGLKCCHWKSNFLLEDALSGKADFDLLVSQEDAQAFETVLSELKFRPARGPGWALHPSIQHYFGLDEESGRIIHLHVYYKLITGGTLLKNYRLPLEPMLFEGAREIGGVPVPSAEAELVVFVLRKILEHASLVDLLFLYRDYALIEKEAEWLCGAGAEESAAALLKRWLPSVEERLFFDSLEALSAGGSVFRRVRLGRRMRRALRSCAILGPQKAGPIRWYRLGRTLIQRFLLRKRAYSPARGGAVIAFVGGDGAGKTTILTETHRWLSEHFAAGPAHAGKPPATFLSFLPMLFLPLFRLLFPKVRINTVEVETVGLNDEESERKRKQSLLYIFRSVLVAFDQERLLSRCFRRASGGEIVLCDRYPSRSFGGMDGPRVDPAWFPSKASWRRILAEKERAIYRKIPRPDCVIFLTVPVEVALRRNASRAAGADSEIYLRRRHALMERWHIPETKVYRINTDQPLDATLLNVKTRIWYSI